MALLLPSSAYAHGGGLNKSGCHNDRRSGGYHCHGGGGYSGGGYTNSPVSLVSVGDGDTIRVTAANGIKVTIRLACIDSPETAQGRSGAYATSTLRRLLQRGPLEIRPQTIDRYGRTVAEVFAGGESVNKMMVRMGAAYVYPQYLRGCDADAYRMAEDYAQRQQFGVWHNGGAEQRPWDFRKSR